MVIQMATIRRVAKAWCLLLLLLPLSLVAQTIRLEAPQTVVQGNTFQLIYSYSGSEDFERVSEPRAQGLQVVYGPARQVMSSYQNINGRSSSSSSVSITYTLIAERTGSVSVPAVTAVVGGKRVTVHGATIRVLPPDKDAQAGRARAKGLGSYIYRAIPSATVVYEQQAFPIRYKLYSSTEFDISSFNAPQYDGFISEKQPDDGRRQLTLESYQGKNYRAVEILNEVLFAQRSGTLTIPSSEVGIRIPVEGDDDPFFSSATFVDRTLRSSPVTIQVRPLPAEGKPQDFSGAVGSFRMKAELLTKTPKTNESVTIRLTLEGTGNLKLASSPKIQFPESFEVYDPKETYEGHVTATNVQGKKVIEYFAIPRRTGSVTVPPLTFSYFDPQKGRYEILRSQSFSLQVAQGKAEVSEEKGSLRQQEESLRTLRSDEGAKEITGLRVAKSWGYLLLYPLVVLIGLGIYFILARRRSLRADSLSYHASRASAVATRRLRKARQLLEAGSREPFYEETLRALWGYLGDKLRLPVSELSRATVSELLRGRGLEESTIQGLTEVIDEVEYARYAPAKEGDMQALYTKTATVISEIDRHKL